MDIRTSNNPANKTPSVSQAERIIEKFGGVKNFSRILSEVGRPYHPVTIRKWTYPKSKGGSAGIIPTAALPDVLFAAAQKGIEITSRDLDPRPTTRGTP